MRVKEAASSINSNCSFKAWNKDSWSWWMPRDISLGTPKRTIMTMKRTSPASSIRVKTKQAPLLKSSSRKESRRVLRIKQEWKRRRLSSKRRSRRSLKTCSEARRGRKIWTCKSYSRRIIKRLRSRTPKNTLIVLSLRLTPSHLYLKREGSQQQKRKNRRQRKSLLVSNKTRRHSQILNSKRLSKSSLKPSLIKNRKRSQPKKQLNKRNRQRLLKIKSKKNLRKHGVNLLKRI